MAAINNSQALDPITGFTLVDGDIEGLNDFSDEEGEVSIPVANTLHITRATPDEYPHLSRVTRAWQRIAKAKEDGYLSEEETPILFKQNQDCRLISRLMSEAFESHGSVEPETDMISSREVYVCRDDDGIVQGMIIIDQKPLHFGCQGTSYIEYLITAPHNLRAQFMNNKELNRIYGAGTALLNHAESRASELGLKYLKLVSVDSAKPFYAKYGFEPVSLFDPCAIWFKTITLGS